MVTWYNDDNVGGNDTDVEYGYGDGGGDDY